MRLLQILENSGFDMVGAGKSGLLDALQMENFKKEYEEKIKGGN